MGCALAKLFGRGEHSQLEEEPEIPKVYSWEKRAQIDTSQFIVENKKGETIGRMPGSINGQQFIINKCEDCHIYVFDHTATVTVDDCVNCTVYIAAIKTSIFVRDCTDCVVATICQQFRTRDCKNISVLVSCVTQPIIEATTGITFGCLQINYPELNQHLKMTGLSIFNNNWSSIHDFTPVPGENNYSYSITAGNMDRLLPLPDIEPYNQVQVTTVQSESLVPYTVGTKQRPIGECCIIAVFHGENSDVIARKVINKLLHLTLVQTIEQKLDHTQASRIFHGSSENTASSDKGPVIFLEFVGPNAVSQCNGAVTSESLEPGRVYVSDSVESAQREVQAIDNLTEMQMAI